MEQRKWVKELRKASAVVPIEVCVSVCVIMKLIIHFGHSIPLHVTHCLSLLSALGRRQPPYVVLQLSGDLCFW